tara:strand:- start:1095 stop:1847 length:753 start_codon:yes stop_codon:yes gene_type:complete
MKYFIENYCPILKKNVPNSKVVFIEQDFSNNYFNRGMLLNIGFDLYKDKTKFYITHDVDIIPNETIIQELFNINNYDVVKIFTGGKLSFGGIMKFSHDDIFFVNGFPNYIWGWGIEDRVLYYRHKILNINYRDSNYGIDKNKKNKTPAVRAKGFGFSLQKGLGSTAKGGVKSSGPQNIIFLPHKHNGNNTHPRNYSSKNNISDNENKIYNSNNLELQKRHIMSSGLNNLKYKILEKININDYVELIKVNI